MTANCTKWNAQRACKSSTELFQRQHSPRAASGATRYWLEPPARRTRSKHDWTVRNAAPERNS